MGALRQYKQYRGSRAHDHEQLGDRADLRARHGQRGSADWTEPDGGVFLAERLRPERIRVLRNGR